MEISEAALSVSKGKEKSSCAVQEKKKVVKLKKGQSPFLLRCLDEWDVYLDEVTRTSVESMLYSHSVDSGYQHIFISPQPSTLEGVNVLVVGGHK